MTPSDFNASVVQPGVRFMTATLPAVSCGMAAQAMLLAIAGQEGGWQFRQQVGGPAHSFWQFEKGGGVTALYRNMLTTNLVAKLCAATETSFDPDSIYQKMAVQEGDLLSFGMARLLLWVDARPLPDPTDDAATWDYYQRNWRPGRPGPDRWAANMKAARDVLTIPNGDC